MSRDGRAFWMPRRGFWRAAWSLENPVRLWFVGTPVPCKSGEGKEELSKEEIGRLGEMVEEYRKRQEIRLAGRRRRRSPCGEA